MANAILDWLKELGDEPVSPKAPLTPLYASHVPIMPPNPPPGEGRDYRVDDATLYAGKQDGYQHPNGDIFNVGVGPFPKRVYRQPKKKPYLAGR